MEEFNKNQFANPNGEEGERLTTHMNTHHKELTEWGLDNLNICCSDVALDIGCGGGLTISMLGKMARFVKGVDISPVSVKASKNFNYEMYNSGRLEVVEADARSLPFDNNQFNIVTAVETVYFWHDILACFHEIHRVLKKGGTFCIIVETYACEERREYNDNLKTLFDVDFNIYSPEQLEIYLNDCGFSDVFVMMHPTNYWLTIYATK